MTDFYPCHCNTSYVPQNNRIKEIAEGVLPVSVDWLILTGNLLETLPSDTGRLVHLRKVMLSNNRISSLPDSMQQCEQIELLRLANNKFEAGIPTWILQLPRLAFLATSGNPCSLDVPAGEIKKVNYKVRQDVCSGWRHWATGD
jgi:hypothetical protein